MADAPDPPPEETAEYLRHYVWIALGLGLAAALLGQSFRALEFAPNMWTAVIERLLAIGIVALFVERAVEIYVAGWRRPGEQYLAHVLDEARRANPEGVTVIRALERRLEVYKLGTRRAALLAALIFGVLIAATGLRVLDGLILLDDAYRASPVWQSRVWFGVDIVLTGAVISGGAAGIHDIVKTVSGLSAARLR